MSMGNVHVQYVQLNQETLTAVYRDCVGLEPKLT